MTRTTALWLLGVLLVVAAIAAWMSRGAAQTLTPAGDLDRLRAIWFDEHDRCPGNPEERAAWDALIQAEAKWGDQDVTA